MDASDGDGDIIKKIEYLSKNIQNPDRNIRQNALKELSLIDMNVQILEEGSLDPVKIENLFDLTYLPILKCYSDKFELCRELAIKIISKLLPSLPKNDYYLDIFVPVITKRVCGISGSNNSRDTTQKSIEDSEEICLLLLTQLSEIMAIFKWSSGNDYLQKSYNDIMDCVLATLKHSDPSVQRKSCTIIKEFSEVTRHFFIRSTELITPLLQMLKHRQYLNRIAAIETIGIVGLYLEHGSNGRDEQYIQIFLMLSPLLMDDHPYVRLACGRIACMWLLKLNNRYSYFERILPMVLCCLNDDIIEIQQEILKLWIECGKQYFFENEQELSKLELIEEEEHQLKWYPLDLVKRPTIGCRALCQRSLRMCTIVLKEIPNWKDDVRLHSLKLLGQMVLHCEKAITVKFHHIYPILSNACMDNDRFVQQEAENVSKLVGALIDYNDWIDIGLDSLNEAGEMQKPKYISIGTLKCFHLIFAACPNGEKSKNIVTVLQLLVKPIICHNTKIPYQLELFKLLEYLLDLYNNTNTNTNQTKQLSPLIEEQLVGISIHDHDPPADNGQKRKQEEIQLFYEILLRVISLADGHKEIVPMGKSLLTNLSDDIKLLHRTYLPALIQSSTLFSDLDSENGDTSEPILLLHGTISICGFQMEYLSALKEAIQTALRHVKAEGKIKILSAISVAMLLWSENMNVSGVSTEQLHLFINECILTHLIWHAGRSAESIRTMATAALCACAEGAKTETFQIYPMLVTHFTTLIDDVNVATRAYAMRCLRHCGPIEDFLKLKQLALAVIGRLDDPSGEIRQSACTTIVRLQLGSDDLDSIASWQECIKYILNKLILHLDDPDKDLHLAALNAITEIAKIHSNVFLNVFNSLQTNNLLNFTELDNIKNLIVN